MILTTDFELLKILSEKKLKETYGSLIPYTLEYDKHKNIAQFSSCSALEYNPIITFNIELEQMFIKKNILDSDVKKEIVEDTLIHEYSHIIYEIFSEYDYSLLDDINTHIDDLDEDFLLYVFSKEMPHILETYDSIEELFDNGFFEEYEYVREEIFVENLMIYIQSKYKDIKPYNYYMYNKEVISFIENNFDRIISCHNSYIIDLEDNF